MVSGGGDDGGATTMALTPKFLVFLIFFSVALSLINQDIKS